MLTDFEYSNLEMRRDRASGAYFAASQLLLIARPFLDAAALAEAEALVGSLRTDYKRLRTELSEALAERIAYKLEQDARERAARTARANPITLLDEFNAAAYEQQLRTTGHLQAA